MKKVKVSIKNQHQLELLELAQKGDYIDLNDVMEVNTDWIIKQIENSKDLVYEQKLELAIKFEQMRHNQILQEKISQANLEKNKLENEINSIENKVKNDLIVTHNKELNELNSKINLLNNSHELNQEKIKNEYRGKINENLTKITELNSTINLLNNSIEFEKEKIKNEYHQKINDNQTKITELQVIIDKAEDLFKIERLTIEKTFEEKITELNKAIDNLKRDRSSLTVKDIGESLETWCDNEFNANNLVLPQNITWQKDNEVVKGGKADFVYKVYANSNRLEDELLTSAILEMKSEDPLAKTVQKLDPFLKKLNDDRNNKNIEYAILVSEIDWKDNNDVPIRRVNEYDKMFIVRPPYFITLLNIITAFGLKYKEILLAEKAERIMFKDSEDILKEFEQMKIDILDLSLKYIENNVEDIIKESNTISKANEKLLKAANTILETHLLTVKNKINNFSINRINRKINDL